MVRPEQKGRTCLFDQRDEIAALEQEIEALAESAERCRKLSLAAKGIIVAGGTLLVLTLVGSLGRSPVALVLGLAALLGGIALQGSNRGTLDEIRATIRERESRRAELIGRIELRLMPD